jgi:hypothetical protein
VTINRPIEEVWAFWLDFFNAPRIRGGMVGLRQTSPGPLAIGSTMHGRMIIFGFETKLSYTITDFDPPRGAAYTVTGRPFRSVLQRITMEATADGTHVVRSTELELRPAFRLLLWPFIPFVRRQRHASFQNLKRLLEAQPPVSGER